MVIDFNRESSNLTEEEIESISQAAKFGDLSSIMPYYEKEMQSPMKNALFGQFVRLILIQVQKAKGSKNNSTELISRR